ncbi:hypothetical protein I4U23_005746 [Adineta vaga]|nr:hypothetical protein I4U23_005746 [Adineta vaga]
MMQTEGEVVSIEEAVKRLMDVDATNTRKINHLECQIDDLMKQLMEYREQNTNSNKTEFQTLSERIESIQLSTVSHFEEMTSKIDNNKRQWNHIVNKLDQISKSVITSSNEHQNKAMKREENDVFQMEPEGNQTITIPTLFQSNGIKHSVIVPPSSAAPAFMEKFRREYAESVYARNCATLPNGILQFLRDSAWEWYCQLRMSHRRPQTWVEFIDLFLIQFNSPVRKARQEQEWHHCMQEENETINGFLVRLRALWREQKSKETELDLVKHFFCRMRNDLLNMIGISRNASLDELINEVQQIEEILYRRAKDERLSKQVTGRDILSKKHYSEDNPRHQSMRWNNESRTYQVNEVTPGQYTNHQTQRTVAPNWSQSADSYVCYHCGEYGHWSDYCPTQHDDYRQQRNKSNSTNDRGALDERTRSAPFK